MLFFGGEEFPQCLGGQSENHTGQGECLNSMRFLWEKSLYVEEITEKV